MDGTDRLSLAGRTALITGSSRNLGLAMAELMAARGARLVVHCRRSVDELERAVETLRATGAEVESVCADISTIEGRRQLADAVPDVDILVNSAATRPEAAEDGVDEEAWREVMALNLEAPAILSTRYAPGMAARGWGRIINISGIDAFWGKSTKPHVVAANLGKVGLARSFAVRYARNGVTANAVVVGAIATTRAGDMANYPDIERGFTRVLGRVPMLRAGTSWEVAEVVAFLASPAASYVTGQELHVNGGAFPTSSDAMLGLEVEPAAIKEMLDAAFSGAG